MDNHEQATDELLQSYFQDILNFPYVKCAFDSVVYDKLLRDGYIYCKSGLVPSNKKSINGITNDSPVYFLIDENNSSDFKDLHHRLLQASIPSAFNPSQMECRLIIYAILNARNKIENNSSKESSKEANSSVILQMLCRYYGKNKFHQYEEFIIRDNIRLLQLQNLQDFFKYIPNVSTSKTLFYRGHSNINYTAVPSLFRDRRFYQKEYQMYQELVIRCPASFTSCYSHLDFLMEMQHYGLPTRLLDITSNPLISLYFACLNSHAIGELICYEVECQDIKYEKCDEVAILTALPMLTYEKQIKLLSDWGNNNEGSQELLAEVQMERPSVSSLGRLEDATQPIVVKPVRKNSRISRQEGAFIIWGLDKTYYEEKDLHESLEEKYRYTDEENKKVVFYILPKNKATILNELNKVGINRAFVYPEIDDVAEYIKENI